MICDNVKRNLSRFTVEPLYLFRQCILILIIEEQLSLIYFLNKLYKQLLALHRLYCHQKSHKIQFIALRNSEFERLFRPLPCCGPCLYV